MEDEVNLEPQSTAVFDWEAAFAELERRRKKKAEEAGEVYVPPTPPQVSSVTIDDTGLVKIFFTKDMAEIADLKVVTETLSVDKTPIFSVKVIRGEYSLPDKMEYSWKVVKMAERYLELQIDFTSPLYISTEEEPEMLEIIISDGSMFLSTDWLPLE